ncbi:methylisocitrate lyase [Sphingobacterium sp. lm-10]|uniref:methylisocitrate lyase n=1 Tax=Sphingobacterium sp. lm-10 TaxID=2944904 RepID=UPI0020211BB3|nr:methylisocitrate lyase [Sphingobacterium sp. lm-10]MCL7986960.1 methylisocitrate lyase [Sphingobacterium sp. lm-10]
MMVYSAGAQLRHMLKQEHPLQIVGTINANHALLAKQAGFRAIYLSGGGVAAGSLGIPDLGITTLQDVLTDIDRITAVCDLPLLVDIDTGFGASAFNIARTIRSICKAGAAGVHIEDQVAAKRCGHRPRKEVVSAQEMVERVQAAVEAKTDPDFVIGARTDAVATEGVDAAIARAVAYQDAGADFIFAEAVTELKDYQRFSEALHIPILANITEFGQTPLFTTEQLGEVGVDMVLYPLSAFRAANKAAQSVFETIRREGSQANAIQRMQTREELYQSINYYAYEDYLNQKQDEGK